MANKFTERAQQALNNALLAASEMGHTYIGSEHLLLGLVRGNCAAAHILSSHHVCESDILSAVTEYAGTGMHTTPRPADMTPRTKRILESAHSAANQTPVGYIGTEHLLYSILEDKDCVASKLLVSLDVNILEVKNELLAILGSGKKPEGKGKRLQIEKKIPETYGRDLTSLAERGMLDPVIGRDDETERMIHILCRRTKNNPCLIGEPGVGKTAVVEGLAARIAAGDVPDTLKNKSIFSLDISSVIAGAKYRGEFEERLRGIMDALLGNTSVILFIDEIHTIVGAGAAEGAVDAANILKPLLARGEIRLIGATTLKEYRKYIEHDAALERRFQPISIDEPSPDKALHILLGLKGRYEKHHSVNIPKETLEAAVRLSNRYIPDRYLPDKAIDLIDEAAARVSLFSAASPPHIKNAEEKIASLERKMEDAVLERNFELAATYRDQIRSEKALFTKAKNTIESPVVTEKDIADVITSWTGIPAGHLTMDESTHMEQLYDKMKARVIGQDDAVAAVTDAIRRSRTGINDPNRPIGSFLFVGPTGVGKTELARVLAEEMYSEKDSFIRLDMSEYKDGFSSSKIIGSPPGYVGYDEGGQLTEKIRRRPYSVVLFDEIEKAHENVYHLLLQILDEGTLTDAQGRHVSFKNTIVILTSNLGATFMTERKSTGFISDNPADQLEIAKKNLIGEIRHFFRAEFLNRLDDIVIFTPLEEKSRKRIGEQLIEATIQRLKNVGIKLRVSKDALDYLVKHGYDPAYGARPLKRALVRDLETPISDMILKGKIKSGSEIEAVVCENKLSFSIQ